MTAPETKLLTEDEAVTVRSFNARIDQLVLALGALELRVVTERNQLLRAIDELGKARFDAIATLAKVHGIDPEDETKGRWNFDYSDEPFRFTKQDPKP